MGGVTYDGAPQNLKRVYYEGTDTIYTGYGLCYNHDSGTAATVEEDRAMFVEKPSTTNLRWFAGAVATGYEGGFTGPGWITIVEPGSYCEVWTDLSVTLDTSFLTLETGQYIFGGGLVGFDGRGSAIAKNTIDRSSTAGTAYAYLQDGPESGLVTITNSAAGGGALAGTVSVGVNYHDTAVTLSADATYTVADGVLQSDRVAVIGGATFTTNDYDVTVTSHTTSDPEHYFLKAAGDYAYMKWWDCAAGGEWAVLGATAPTAT